MWRGSPKTHQCGKEKEWSKTGTYPEKISDFGEDFEIFPLILSLFLCILGFYHRN